MKAYIDIVKKVLKEGVEKKNRTGISTLAVPGVLFEHDMEQGFPLLTTKHVPFRLVASELEFFIKGLTDKNWLISHDNHIWDEWCNPEIVPYGHDEKTKKSMKEERDLGPIYGWQWRNFGASYVSYDKPPGPGGKDQLRDMIERIKTDPFSRRLIVSAWNPVDLHRMALPACHYGFQVLIAEDKLNLLWNQRSVDVALGLPFNIASYALLLCLIARETNYKEGKLVGFLADTHIYANHVQGLKEQISREPFPLPRIRTDDFQSLFDWKYQDTAVENYQHHPRILFEVAV